MDKIKSRKLWVTVGAVALASFAEQFGIDLSQETILALAAVVVAYLTGQAVIDKAAVKSEAEVVAKGADNLIKKLTNTLERVAKQDANTELYKED